MIHKEVVLVAMKRCNKGHFYDCDKYTNCPYCGVNNLDIQGSMARKNTQKYEQDFATVPMQNAVINNKSVREPGETIGIFQQKIGIDPVVGWLVCVEGPVRGQDYPLHSGKNSIGRSRNMDICISADDYISRENHAFIVFDPKKATFRVQTGESRGLVYLNNEEVLTYADLKADDIMEIGQTKLIFMPFCGVNFQWT